MSAIGSVIVMTAHPLPTGFLHARQLALQGELPEADTTERKIPHVRSRPAALSTASYDPVAVFGRSLRLLDESFLRHIFSYELRLKGMPSSSISRLPSSSLRAVVPMFTCIPRTRSTLSYSISGKMSCSRMPKLKLP